MTTAAQIDVRRGGYWLLEDTAPDAVFTPERLSEEHRLMGRTAHEFVKGEVLPRMEHLEAKEWDVARMLVKRCGELGLLGTDAAEAWGGLDLDKVSSLVVGEALGTAGDIAAGLQGSVQLPAEGGHLLR